MTRVNKGQRSRLVVAPQFFSTISSNREEQNLHLNKHFCLWDNGTWASLETQQVFVAS